jgi:hypothetical protein
METVELVTKLEALQAKRKERAQVVAKMEELEKSIRQMIRQSLIASGMKTANFDGVGSVTVTGRDHAEIRDFSKMANFIMSYMMKAKENGGAPEDALSLLQRRAALGNIQDLLALGFTAEEMGIEIVEKPDITFTPLKGNAK